MFCFHKYGNIENGYQYCEKCGKAKPVKCNHIFTIIRAVRLTYHGDNVGTKIIFQCQKCGIIKKDEL